MLQQVAVNFEEIEEGGFRIIAWHEMIAHN